MPRKAGSRITRKGEEAADEIIAQSILNAAQDPSIVTQQALTNRLAEDNPNLTATERLRLVSQGQSTAQNLPGLLAPTVLPDLEAQTATQLAEQNIEAQLRATPQARMVGDISDFRENPTQALIEKLNLGKDGNNPGAILGLFGESGFDPNNLENLINDYARELEVTPEIAAVAMREAFIRDPTTILGFNRNTLRNRFPLETVRELVEGNLSQDQLRRYRRERGVAIKSKEQLSRMNNALEVLLARQAKGEPGLEEDIASLRSAILEYETKNPINTGR